MVAIGIDLGTTNSCVGIWKDNTVEIIPNHLGHRTTPSWVAFNKDQKIIGHQARQKASSNPRNTIFDVKRLMGRYFSEVELDLDNYSYDIVPDQHGLPLVKVDYNNNSDRTFKPEEISAMILTYLKESAEAYLDEKVTQAVITVPAYFNDFQRQATKDAATIAGLECLRIINEPTAACLCYGLNKQHDDFHVLVYDFGGGTLDVSVLNLDSGFFQVLSTCGDSHLGGEDIDWAMVKYVYESAGIHDLYDNPKKLKKLQLVCEQVKRELSQTECTQIYVEDFISSGEDLDMTMTRAQFENLIQPILDRAFKPVKRVLKDSGIDREQIDEIVLVGGSTRIPVIQSKLSEYFNHKKLNKSVNPDEAVAYGAAVQVAILTDKSETSTVKDMVLLDVTPLSLGIETAGGTMAKIVERNTNIPCQQSKMFTTSEDNQESVLVQVFEGERKFTRDCHRLGTFELGPIPEAPRGVPKIKVTFTVDSNGILQVSAMDNNTGIETHAELTPESGRLTTEEIQKMVRNADQFKIQDEVREANIESYTQFERYLYSIQQAVNDEEINVDASGQSVLSEEEISFVNQYVINSFKWINDNRDDISVNSETINNARMSIEHNLKPFMVRLFSH
jgi:L1 cell adhesion molecule like protein